MASTFVKYLLLPSVVPAHLMKTRTTASRLVITIAVVSTVLVGLAARIAPPTSPENLHDMGSADKQQQAIDDSADFEGVILSPLLIMAESVNGKTVHNKFTIRRNSPEPAEVEITIGGEELKMATEGHHHDPLNYDQMMEDFSLLRDKNLPTRLIVMLKPSHRDPNFLTGRVQNGSSTYDFTDPWARMEKLNVVVYEIPKEWRRDELQERAVYLSKHKSVLLVELDKQLIVNHYANSKEVMTKKYQSMLTDGNSIEPRLPEFMSKAETESEERHIPVVVICPPRPDDSDDYGYSNSGDKNESDLNHFPGLRWCNIGIQNDGQSVYSTDILKCFEFALKVEAKILLFPPISTSIAATRAATFIGYQEHVITIESSNTDLNVHSHTFHPYASPYAIVAQSSSDNTLRNYSNYGKSSVYLAVAQKPQTQNYDEGYETPDNVDPAFKVAAVAAQMMSANRDLSAASVREILRKTSTSPQGEDGEKLQWGVLNEAAAYEAARQGGAWARVDPSSFSIPAGNTVSEVKLTIEGLHADYGGNVRFYIRDSREEIFTADVLVKYLNPLKASSVNSPTRGATNETINAQKILLKTIKGLSSSEVPLDVDFPSQYVSFAVSPLPSSSNLVVSPAPGNWQPIVRGEQPVITVRCNGNAPGVTEQAVVVAAKESNQKRISYTFNVACESYFFHLKVKDEKETTNSTINVNSYTMGQDNNANNKEKTVTRTMELTPLYHNQETSSHFFCDFQKLDLESVEASTMGTSLQYSNDYDTTTAEYEHGKDGWVNLDQFNPKPEILKELQSDQQPTVKRSLSTSLYLWGKEYHNAHIVIAADGYIELRNTNSHPDHSPATIAIFKGFAEHVDTTDSQILFACDDNRVIVEWRGFYYESQDSYINVQLIVESDGDIFMNYKDMYSPDLGTAYISSENGEFTNEMSLYDYGMQGYDQPGVNTISIKPASTQVNWMSITPSDIVYSPFSEGDSVSFTASISYAFQEQKTGRIAYKMNTSCGPIEAFLFVVVGKIKTTTTTTRPTTPNPGLGKDGKVSKLSFDDLHHKTHHGIHFPESEYMKRIADSKMLLHSLKTYTGITISTCGKLCMQSKWCNAANYTHAKEECELLASSFFSSPSKLTKLQGSEWADVLTKVSCTGGVSGGGASDHHEKARQLKDVEAQEIRGFCDFNWASGLKLCANSQSK